MSIFYRISESFDEFIHEHHKVNINYAHEVGPVGNYLNALIGP